MSGISSVARAWLRRAVRAGLLRHAPRSFARWCRPDAHELGELGEELAARELIRVGYTVIGRRVRTRHAEVDVLARHRECLVCVEVKTSQTSPPPSIRGTDAGPIAAPFRVAGRLGRPQRARLARAARDLARRRGLRARVDRVDVTVESGTGRVRVAVHADVGRETERPSGSTDPWRDLRV